MDSPDLSPAAISEALTGISGGLPAASVRRLTGGYSWITLRVDFAAASVIVRVAPLGGTVEPYDPESEALRLRAAAPFVRVPEVLGVFDTPNPLGRPFGVYSFLEGEVVRKPADPKPYVQAAVEALGGLHGGADASLVDPARSVGEAISAELGRMNDQYRRCWRHPGIDVALRWLRHHKPDCGESPTLCHGDFRPANLLWTGPGRLSGVIDWERAWAGDPHCDLAFSMLFGGWASVEGSALEGYVRSGGVSIVRERLAYALRLERVRAYLSAMTGLAALFSGRSDDLRLFGIGGAAQAGAWDLVRWLEAGLPPLGEVVPRPPEVGCPLHVACGDSSSPLAEAGLPARSDLPVVQGLEQPDLAEWELEWGRLLERADDCGPELTSPLLELGRRDAPLTAAAAAVRWRDLWTG